MKKAVLRELLKKQELEERAMKVKPVAEPKAKPKKTTRRKRSK